MFPFLAAAGSVLTVDVTERGGHVGFVERFAGDGLVRTWALACAIEFLGSRG